MEQKKHLLNEENNIHGILLVSAKWIVPIYNKLPIDMKISSSFVFHMGPTL